MKTISFLSQCENLDILPAGIIILNSDYTVLCWNRTIAQWTGIPREKVLCRDLREIFPHLRERRYELRIAQVFEGGAAAFFSTQFHPHFIPAPLPGGGLRFQRTTVHALVEGDEIYALVFIDDVTDLVFQVRAYREMRDRALREIEERHMREAALRALSAELKTIIDNAPAMIWYKDTRNRFIRVNPAAAAAIGLPPEEIEGKSAFDLFPGMAKKYYEDDLEVISTKKPKLGIIEQMQTKTRGTRWVETHKVPLIDEGENVTGILLFVTDITERKLAQDALSLANRKLNLLSTITRHDLLNQVSALKWYIELAREEKDMESIMGILDKMGNVLQTVEKQIEFTRDYQEIGVREAVWQNVAEIAKRIRDGFSMSGVSIVLEMDDVEVYADPLFEKVIFNLFENAIRYGGPALSRIRVFQTEGPDGLVIVVEDNGAGIPEEDKKHLFKKGFGKHTGLGLFLSREILSITGLSIRETGEPGKGARFEILVPEGKFRRQ